MLPTSMLIYLAILSLCALFGMTNSGTSTMWKLNTLTGKIEQSDLLVDEASKYAQLDENVLFNFNAMAEVYSRDKQFFTIVSSTRIDNHNGWLRQSADNSLESLLQARKLKTEPVATFNNKNTPYIVRKLENKVSLRNSSKDFDILDCGQPVNNTNYDYIINLVTHYKYKQTPTMPEPDVIYFFLHSHDQENYKNFNVENLEKRLKYFKKHNPLSAELYHHIGNYWRIIGKPVQAIKCFCRSLDISPSASEVMYDLAKVLYNLQYLDDAINLARRSIEFQASPFSAWRQYLLLGDIMKAYGDLRGSVHYYRLALELNPTQDLILRSLDEAEQKPAATLHVYTVLIIITLVILVLIVVLASMITEMRGQHHYIKGHCVSNLDMYDKPHRHFNRAIAMRSLKGYSTSRSARHRKY